MKKIFNNTLNNIITGLILLFPINTLFAQHFLNDFEDGTLNNWKMGNATSTANSVANVPTGGPDGANDNYLRISPDGSGSGGKLTILNEDQWLPIKNFTSLGITKISFFANNLNASESIDLRIAIRKTGGASSQDDNYWCVTTTPVHLDAVVGWVAIAIPIEAADMTDLGDATLTPAQILTDVKEVRIIDCSGLAAHRGDETTDQLGLDDITDGDLVPPNNPPVLSWTGETGYESDGVNPDQGEVGDSYTFRVKYSDADSNAPAAGYPRVNIFRGGANVFGGPLTMNQINSDPFDSGRIYTVNVTLDTVGSNYSYYFEAQDNNGDDATGDPTSSTNGPVVTIHNDAPVLSWTAETGYESDGVNPDQGTTDDSYVFRVKYSDANGNAPAGGYPRVFVFKDTMDVFGGPLTMNQINGDPFDSGRIYTVSANLTKEGSDYSYRFEAKDMNNADATGDPTSSSAGPVVTIVNNAPVLSWTGETGYESDGVNPNQGTTADSFVFRVKYSDTDNDAPDSGYPRLNLLKNGTAISGSPFLMNQADNNSFSSGRIFKVSVNLSGAGDNYTYSFEAQDINKAAATGDATALTGGPVVTRTNDAPVLSWTGETGYESDGVNPNQGTTADPYIFRVEYSDANDDVPAAGYPRLNLLKNGTAISGSPFTMNAINNNPVTSGRIYAFTIPGSTLSSGMDYSYYFEAQDTFGLSATGDPVNPVNGPIVNEPTTPFISLGTVPDTLIGGEPFNITWNSNNILNVKIEYVDANNNHSIIVNTYPADSMHYLWMVPQVVSDNYSLFISAAGNTAIHDSSTNFSIINRYVKIIEPNGGEVFDVGDTIAVSWFAPYESDFRLEYTIDAGRKWNFITDVIQTSGPSSETWIVPMNPSTQCLVRVTDKNHPAVNDQSDAVFMINLPPSVSVNEFPDILIAGQQYQIKWTATKVDSIKIELVDNQGNANIIEQSYSALAGQYMWTIPQTEGSGFFLRLSSVADTSVFTESNTFAITIDQTGPQFIDVNMNPDIVEFGQATTDSIKVSISDDSGVADNTVMLHYRISGVQDYSTTAMTFHSAAGNTKEFHAGIAISAVNDKGIQLYISAKDLHNNMSQSNIYSIGVNMSAASDPDPPRSGFALEDYKLFSIPLILKNTTVKNFLDINPDLGSDYDPHVYRLFAYQNGSVDGFIEYTGGSGFPALLPGKGFFIITAKDVNISSGAGTTVDVSADFEISGLQSGWNVIGNPFNFNVAVDSLYASAQVSGFQLWEYNGQSGWQNISSGSLKPWKGYALYLNATQNNLSFFIPPDPAIGLAKSLYSVSNNSAEEWMIQIEAENGHSQSTFNFAGQLKNASDDSDLYDLDSPPLIGHQVFLSFDNPAGKLQVTDIRESNEKGHTWDFSCHTTPSGKTLSLNFKGIKSIDETNEIFLIDKNTGISYNLRQNSSLNFVAAGEMTKSYQFIVGTKDYLSGLNIADKLFPKKFELYNNFPNPFNPQTQITFSLARSENIKLIIYDVLGQKVAVLKDGFVEAGNHSLVWNAGDKSSGVYFIHLVAGRNVKTIRAVLLK